LTLSGGLRGPLCKVLVDHCTGGRLLNRPLNDSQHQRRQIGQAWCRDLQLFTYLQSSLVSAGVRVTQNGLKVKVHVWDEDGRTRHDFVDSLQTGIMVTAAASESAAHWTPFIIRARTRSPNISLRRLPYSTSTAHVALAASSGKRNVTVCRPSVCPSVPSAYSP